MLRVVVVEDSRTVRARLVAALEAEPSVFQVVAEGSNGEEAIALCERLRPDVVVCDIMMPRVSGIEATAHIMAYFATPILIVSSSERREEGKRALDALAAGAVDALEKPGLDDDLDAWDARFRARVRLVSRVKVITHPQRKLAGIARTERAERASNGALPVEAKVAPAPSRPPHPSKPPHPPRASQPLVSSPYRVCAMGASTGGPEALAKIIPAIPTSFPLPILLVVHVDAPFDASLAEWLDGLGPVRVKCAVDGMPLPPPGQGGIFLAPAGRHLELEEGKMRLTSAPEQHSCRPSVDVLFRSVARAMGRQTIGCLLSGMGADGADGLLALRHAGAYTLVQDEASCVIFGMPGAAVKLGAAMAQVAAKDIAPFVGTLVAGAKNLSPVGKP